MTTRVAIRHQTTYHYDNPVELSPHLFRLRPAVHCRTPIESYALKIRPTKHYLHWQQDPFGNYQARVVFNEPTTELHIDVELVATLTVVNPFDFFVEEYAKYYPFSYGEVLLRQLQPYLQTSDEGRVFDRWLAHIDGPKRYSVDFLVALNRMVNKDIAYSIRLKPGVQSCEETLQKGVGSCRDSAWLLVQALRHRGLAARFVSGYLVQLAPDFKVLDEPAGPEQDFTDLHAWVEAFVPGAGWIGLDPTSGLFAAEGHIPLACTPEPINAAPVTGSYVGKAECSFSYHNQVTRFQEEPRTTKPYDEEQWQAINALGQAIDEELTDVRLTMGGEPTFTTVDAVDAAEWNTAADGPHKRGRAYELLRRLHTHFALGGVRQSCQGKWYPGEPLPRWLLACHWRADGRPVWHRQDLLATEGEDCGATLADARKLAHAIASRLKVHPGHILAGFEDSLHALWQEGGLPTGVDPLAFDLDDSHERNRLARILSHGLNRATGYALPLAWDYARQDWQSSLWTFRLEEMFLLPGDSPMGLRLPITALPGFHEREQHHERSLFEPLPPLGDRFGEVARRYSQWLDSPSEPPAIHPQHPDGQGRAANLPVHTALCVEPRGGCLWVFLPPLTDLEHYLALLAAIEAAATDCETPVCLEGYGPPRDPRLISLQLSPDPGVIEVNIHPSASWGELVDNVSTLYEAARLSRLTAEKFLLDGRHTGTGGGNHVTLGGATPGDSPLLRRPDLLRSLITYWQHHPSLSYLFSGLFVGPTSQAPRVDEGRQEMLYELEIAFSQIAKGEANTPWLVDRLLRNLLVDVTGNTHRAEFCIDKLYSPESERGRLGLLELRAFEMPPHPQMSLVQMLLVRALVARFWQEPYLHPLVRWGTELHDRFMLPHYVAADIGEVVSDLQKAGYPLQKSWFQPFLNFRFPQYGKIRCQNIELELRFAIEPWHVLGEETSAQGTARYVDSSVERLQVKVDGLAESRFIVTCNGRRVPLRNTGKRGEFVGGVRYRAWQPPSALHPNIKVHAPLVFDIVDLWNERAIGGCTYHVCHPGGRHFAAYPVNANEAESRRAGRFWNFGHTPGTVKSELLLADEGDSLEYPYTLDLRRPPPRKA